MIQYRIVENKDYSTLVHDWQEYFGVPMTMRMFLWILIADENFDHNAVLVALDD